MPGVEVDFDFGASDAISEMREISDEWPAHREAILEAVSQYAVGEMKREIPTDTGRAKSTVRAVDAPGQSKMVVKAGGQKGVDYIGPLLYGTDPHPPGAPTPEANPSLARWARRNNYPGGFEAIYWNIAKYGTEPHDFVSGPVEETQSNAGDIGQQVLENRGVFD